MAEATYYGIIAEFDSPEALIEATRSAREAGYRDLDAFTPFPVEGLAELLHFRDGRVPRLGLIGGCLGFVIALAMQGFTTWDYPINVGGRPLYALSAFAVVTFELTILFAALLAAFGMIYLSGLPRLHHPLFAASRFHLASRDRFFLCIKSNDPKFNDKDTAQYLKTLNPASIEPVPA
jgi:Protein of unknown function (DUF3341)